MCSQDSALLSSSGYQVTLAPSEGEAQGATTCMVYTSMQPILEKPSVSTRASTRQDECKHVRTDQDQHRQQALLKPLRKRVEYRSGEHFIVQGNSRTSSFNSNAASANSLIAS